MHTIREAVSDEVERMLGMYEWLFEPPGYTPRWWDPGRARDALLEAIQSDRSAVLVAEQDGELVGLCTAYLGLNSVRFGQRCWVEDLGVHPDHRSEGIGGCSSTRPRTGRGNREQPTSSSTPASRARTRSASTSAAAIPRRGSATPGRCDESRSCAATAYSRSLTGSPVHSACRRVSSRIPPSIR